jgi:pre-mRNA-splicing factor ATP-dependent RNA helicase DHX38/PRP16
MPLSKVRPSLSDPHLADHLAVSAFGKFPEETILSLHTRILTQLAVDSKKGHRRGSGHSPPRMLGAKGAGGAGEHVEGMDHDRSDVLASEPRRKGGLIRSDNVCLNWRCFIVKLS